MKGFTTNRRRFLLGAAAAAATWPAGAAGMGEMRRMAPNKASENFRPDVEIDLLAQPATAPILPGRETRVWRYAATRVMGPENTLAALPNSYLGPILRFATGQKIRIRLRNDLPESHITHWHGLHVPEIMDGHPDYVVDPGETYVYEFEMKNRAGMHIYHPHPHERTATQVYRGLAGAILVSDEEEKALGLPSGDYEIPIVLQDRSFDDDNQLLYGGDMHTGMFGFYGARLLVNGRPDFRLEAASRAYRFRILNACNARILKLGWSDGTPLTVIGCDGGLLEAPQTKPYVMLAPGERLDVFADFSGRPVGSRFSLKSLAYDAALPMMARRMMDFGDMEAPPGGDYDLFPVTVTRAVGESPALPQRLSKLPRRPLAQAANPNDPTPIALSEAPMRMLINGRPYDDDILPVERVGLNSVRLFEIFHDHGGGMGMMGGMGMDGMGMGGRGMGMGGMGMRGRGMGMGMGGMGRMLAMSHPIHLHGQQFEVLGRSFEGADASAYDTIRHGFIDSGLKDTVLVSPGERVRILKPFDDFPGRFMFHCHILEHEDMGMMRQFLVA